MGNIYTLRALCSPLNKKKENYPILKQIYDILAEHKIKILHYVKYLPAHIEIKRNEQADKAAKQSIDMPGITTRRLLYTDHQEYKKLQMAKRVGKYWSAPTTVVGNMRLSWVNSVMNTLD